MGWLYEAEDMLRKVQVEHLSRKHAALYAAVNADVLLKTKQYKEAIPFVKLAMPEESKKMYKPRFQYVLGQLYQLQGDRKQAKNAFEKVLKMQPSNEMDFNARLQLAELNESTKDGVKLLEKMAKLDKNKDQLDRIYGSIGNIYLRQKDTVQALANYEKAIESSTQNGIDKANVLVIAGDIYYKQCNYIKASPCYKEATQILSAEHDDYERVQKRSETLDELVVEYEVVVLQDSLQMLSKLPLEEQKVVVDSIIARLIRAEEEAKQKEEQAARDAANGVGPRSVNTSNMIGGGAQDRDWYFYNPALMRNGQQSFKTQWGNRTLEDNWRRMSKAMSGSSMEEEEYDDEMANDSTANAEGGGEKAAAMEMDDHKPEYYLQQIPKTEEDIAQSNELIANALYNMVYIYRDRVGDQAQSDATFREFCKRFPQHKLLVDLYYMQYLTALKNNDMGVAEGYRQDILQLFPESKEATIVSQPDYFNKLRRMSQEQDSLYEQTYLAFTKNEYKQVKNNKLYAEENYPLSPLMPRFLFLNAIAVARTDGQNAFVSELRDMVERYPDSELASMSKDMLALMGQGAESQKGDMSSLQNKRQTEVVEETVDSVTVEFDKERRAPSLVLLILEQDEKKLNQLLYEIALFNFTQFMIKDFDIRQVISFDAKRSAIQIAGFEKMDEAEWYCQLLAKNAELSQRIAEYQVQVIAITEGNMEIMSKHFTLEEYLEFCKPKVKGKSKT
jgi:tetratricopeptide (TPR) repeat protein